MTTRRYAKRLSVEERRPLLLDAALAVIVEEGYAGATLNAIAERAGVTKPVIYSSFGDRDAFLLALLDREEQRALDTIRRAVPDLGGVSGARGVAAAVEAGVSGFLAAVRDEPDPWRLIFTESDATPAPVRRRIARDRGVVQDALTTAVRAGLPLLGRSGLEPELLAQAFFAIVERYARLAVEDPDGFDTVAAARVVATLAAGDSTVP